MRGFWAYLWAFPTTAVGLMIAPLALFRGGGIRLVNGVVEVWSRWIAALLRDGTLLPLGAMAMTLGHVIIGRDARTLERCRAHEHIHVRQCERWGPLFLPLYLASSIIAWLRGGDLYRDNPFESEAFGATAAS